MSSCIAPQPVAYFFPGTGGPPGPQGLPSSVPGPAGAAGAAGGVGVYTGAYVSSRVYYDTQYRKDIVSFNGSYWITNNVVKNGLSTWNSPTISDWLYFGDSLIAVATKLELVYDSTIAVGLELTAPGFLRSTNQVANTSGLLLTGAGRLEAFDALINGLVSTNTPKFNVASVTRTMPGVGLVQYASPAIADGAITVNPTINNVTDNALIVFGWLQGANNYIENRFGNSTQKFRVTVQGVGQNVSAGTDLFYIQLYYRTRTNGGAWSAWTIIGSDAYMNKLAAQDQSYTNTQPLSVALTGLQDIQFSAGFSKGSGGGAAASISAAIISVEIYN